MSAVNSLLTMMAIGEAPDDSKHVTESVEAVEILPGKDAVADDSRPASKNENDIVDVDVDGEDVEMKQQGKPPVPTSLSLNREIPEIVFNQTTEKISSMASPLKSPGIDSSHILGEIGSMTSKLSGLLTSVGVTSEDIKQYSDTIRSEKEKEILTDEATTETTIRDRESATSEREHDIQTTDKDEEELDIDDLVASGYSMDEIDQMIDEQENRRLNKENMKKKKEVDEANSECKEDDVSEDDDLKEPNIDELIEYGYSMEEIDIMIYEYETEKKIRKQRTEGITETASTEYLTSEEQTSPRHIFTAPVKIVKVEPILTPNEKELKLLDDNIKSIETDIDQVDRNIEQQRNELKKLEQQKINKDKERKQLVKFINDNKGMADDANEIKQRKMMQRKREEEIRAYLAAQDDNSCTDHTQTEEGLYQCTVCFNRTFATKEEFESHDDMGGIVEPKKRPTVQPGLFELSGIEEEYYTLVAEKKKRKESLISYLAEVDKVWEDEKRRRHEELECKTPMVPHELEIQEESAVISEVDGNNEKLEEEKVGSNENLVDKNVYTDEEDLKSLDIDTLIAEGHELEEIEKMMEEQENEKKKREQRKKDKMEKESKCKEHGSQDDLSIMSLDIDGLVAEGYDLDQIEKMMEVQETEKKKRKEEKRKKKKKLSQEMKLAAEQEAKDLDQPTDVEIEDIKEDTEIINDTNKIDELELIDSEGTIVNIDDQKVVGENEVAGEVAMEIIETVELVASMQDEITDIEGDIKEFDATTPPIEEPTPPVEESTPAVEESTPAVEEPTHAVDEPTPAVEESPTAVEESTPDVEESTPAVEEPAGDVTEKAISESKKEIKIEETVNVETHKEEAVIKEKKKEVVQKQEDVKEDKKKKKKKKKGEEDEEVVAIKQHIVEPEPIEPEPEVEDNKKKKKKKKEEEVKPEPIKPEPEAEDKKKKKKNKKKEPTPVCVYSRA